ncbi:dihydrolipoyllysine-residue acetyltransferase [Halomonas sp. V046]|uniref:dihydrolipoyllysine-residue acetyltransferase n=1 Tax=Halomonas sp. V046 TaxID=3459611 RepID=UPI004043B511
MTEFKLPDIGEGIVECEVMEWKVAEGDTIAEDQPVVEVMTDKALVEITAPEAGRITRLHVAKGDMARVHAALFAYDAEDEAAEAGTPTTTAMHSADTAATPRQPERADAGEARRRVDFILPDIGEGIVECEVVQWHVAVGDAIAEDQSLVDVMTDKAMVEITAPEDGVVSELYVAKGEMAKVHAPLFAYRADAELEDADASGAAGERQPSTDDAATKAPTEAPASASAQAAATASDNVGKGVGKGAGKGAYGRIPASPAVRRLIREHDLRLEQVPGSGPQGRVLKEDVRAFIESDGASQRPATGAAEVGTASQARMATPGQEARVEPLKGVRAAMARQMVASASTIPHFQYGEELDVTELLALRERLKPEAQAREVRLTLMPFFMKAMALAIRDNPLLNARLNAEASEIHYLPSCNIGMAVDGRAGLMVPNVKSVESLSLLGVAAEVARLTDAARQGRVAPEDLKGGTISISNIGALGGTYAAPIINAPEVAIVAIGKTQWLPRFDSDDRVVKRAIMTVTWAGDHRLLDGGAIARFCNAWKGYLEAPESMLLHLS